MRYKMNTQTIKKIIENIKSYGYHPDTINHNEKYIDIHYDSINFSFDTSHKPLAITVNANIEYRMTFDQENIEYLNSKGITKWSIYKYWLTFTYYPSNEKDLEDTLKDLLDAYN
jgi:hypothetical protein